jgi:hypothetical protein
VQLWLYHSVALGKVYLQVLQRNLSNTCTNPWHKYMRLQRKAHKSALKITIVQQLCPFQQTKMKMTRTGMIIISRDSLTKYQTITTRMNGSYYLSFVPNDFINSQQSYNSILKTSDTDAKICIPSFQNQQGNSVMMVASTQTETTHQKS